MNYIDIHTHILPGIDDGPVSIRESLQMLRQAYESGVRTLVATPHLFLEPYQNQDVLEINDRFASFVAEIRHCRETETFGFLREMKIYLGGEHFISPDFLDALAEGRILTLNGSRYLLIEALPFYPLRNYVPVIERIFQAGWIPVVAHAERNLDLQKKPVRMAAFVTRGCLCQVNATSFLESSPPGLRKAALSLLDNDLIHLVASDAHDTKRRPTLLQESYRTLEKSYPAGKLLALFRRNPGLVVANQEVPVSP